MTFRWLQDDQVNEVHAAAVETGLFDEMSQRALLASLDAAFVSTLDEGSNKSAQLLLVLHRINAIQVLEDGRVPLELVLKNAIALTRALQQSQVFRAALDAVLGRRRAGSTADGGADTAAAGPFDPSTLSRAAREMLAAFSDLYAGKQRQIDRVEWLKSIHEELQKMEPIADSLRQLLAALDEKNAKLWRLLAPPTRRDLIPALDKAIRLLGPCASAAVVDESFGVIRDHLNEARDLLGAAVAKSDVDAMQGGLEVMQTIVGRDVSLVNSRLVEAARTLDLSEVVESLHRLEATLGPNDTQHASVGQVVLRVRLVHEAWHPVKALVQVHDAWQALDCELREKLAIPGRLVQSLRRSWARLVERLAGLVCSAQAQDWAHEIQQACDRVGARLADGKPDDVEVEFDQFKSLVLRRFTDVDCELLERCGQVRQAGDNLETVLVTIAGPPPARAA